MIILASTRHAQRTIFLLPHIDQIVDYTSGCDILSFLDAYSGFHQITMKESNQLMTSFITPYHSYYYVTMPFGLKNADTTKSTHPTSLTKSSG